jgi:3-hydroxyisobutyrate dehydrogenase-like beta-hydroxyacid dehydrogenase
MTKIGFVGLGSMGAPIAGRLLDLQTSSQVYGTNRTREKAGKLVARGLHWRDTPREVAAAADFVFSMVTDDAALDEITSGPDGILAGLRPGAVYVDMSTVSPRASRKLADKVRAAGATLLDAPVSGSVPAAEAGTLAIMVGGPEDAFRAALPLLSRLGSSVTRVGENGKGLLLKMAINISLASQMMAFSEGLALAERGGIDPKLAAETMAASAIGSPMLKARVPLVLDLPERAWFDMALMHKDIRLALDAARDPGLMLPAASAANVLLTLGEEMGYAHRDIAGFYEVLTRIANSAAAPASTEDVPEQVA